MFNMTEKQAADAVASVNFVPAQDRGITAFVSLFGMNGMEALNAEGGTEEWDAAHAALGCLETHVKLQG